MVNQSAGSRGEVLDVTFALVMIVLMLLVVSLGLGPSTPSHPARRRARGEDRTRSPLGKPPVTRTANRMADEVGLEWLEAKLTAYLLAGQVSAAQYQQCMAVLAAQDAVRRPLVVPPARDV